MKIKVSIDHTSPGRRRPQLAVPGIPPRRGFLVPAFAGFTALATAVPSCTPSTERTVVLGGSPDAGPAISFTPPDGGDSIAAPPEPMAYCAATACPAPHTTCPTSEFPCDVNLMTDADNCGACGVVCPAKRGNAEFACVQGACKMTCLPGYADCNGVVDDDCEVKLGSNGHCSKCGDACTDPAKPCVLDISGLYGRCGCDPGMQFCPTAAGGSCIDPQTADTNCGACGVVCDRTGGGASTPPNMQFGCGSGQCGALKCASLYLDCDKDIDNGCEASAFSPTSCGACGVVCKPGQTCSFDPATFTIACQCPAGQTNCGGTCVELGSNPNHCGGCGIRCSGAAGPNANAICSFGSCGVLCQDGWGECNGDAADGCETNLQSDPLNCGTCGNACDVAAGQPCIAGRCAVEPCGPGGPTK